MVKRKEKKNASLYPTVRFTTAGVGRHCVHSPWTHLELTNLECSRSNNSGLQTEGFALWQRAKGIVQVSCSGFHIHPCLRLAC